MTRSVPALRQAMARMLYDAAYADRVYAGPVDGLTEEERALLTRIDRRAWGTDRYRRPRATQALIEEYPVTAAVLGVPGVSAFFSSDAFGRTLSDRGSTALDFGSWAEGRIGPTATLERAIATARRAWPRAGRGLATRPGLEPLVLPNGTLDLYLRMRKALGPDPVAALAKGRPMLPPAPPRPGEAPLLVERDANGEVQLGGASRALVDLLTATRTAHPRARVLAEARRLGCDPGEDAELIDSLVADGTLVQVG